MNYALEFLAAQTDEVIMTTPYTQDDDFYIKARIKMTEEGVGPYTAMGKDSPVQIWFGMNNGSNKFESYVFNLFTLPQTIVAIDTWYEIEIGYRNAAEES